MRNHLRSIGVALALTSLVAAVRAETPREDPQSARYWHRLCAGQRPDVPADTQRVACDAFMTGYLSSVAVIETTIETTFLCQSARRPLTADGARRLFIEAMARSPSLDDAPVGQVVLLTLLRERGCSPADAAADAPRGAGPAPSRSHLE